MRLIQWVLLLAWSASLMSCMTEPKNGKMLSSTNQRIQFAGYVPNPGKHIQFQVRELSGSLCDHVAWRNLSSTTSSTTASFTDECGVKWYAYSRNVTLPDNTKYWCDFSSFGFFYQEVRTLMDGVLLASFDTNVNCNPSKNCGANVISECQSGMRGTARMTCWPSEGCDVTFF